MRPTYEVAQVIRAVETELNELGLNSWQQRALYAISKCRTSALGGHIDNCHSCGGISVSYNSCRNRHCPKCQGQRREQWIQARELELLPVPYFHVVFTLPEQINRLCLYAPQKVYNLLFEVSWSVVRSFAADPNYLGGQSGMISVLHTWGQTMSLHPHVHCIVPGGGLVNGRWKRTRSKGKYLFPVRAMSAVFRARFTARLRQEFPQEDQSLYDALYGQNWVVYAKRAFGGPQSVVEYLGRYTHKIAISNHRIENIDQDGVEFRYNDYRDGKSKRMRLDKQEFVRRFSLHILHQFMQ